MKFKVALTPCNFMIYKEYKISLKLVFPIRVIKFRIQDCSCFPVSHRVTIHSYIFLKPIPSKLPYCIIHQLLITHFFINKSLLPKFIQALHTDKTISTKNNPLVPCDGVLNGILFFSSFSFVFIQFRRGIFNSFAFSNNDVLFIYYFVILN